MRIEQDLTELVEFLIQGPERATHQFHVVFREILFLSSPEFGPRKRTISALEPQSPNASFLSKPSIQISSKNSGKTADQAPDDISIPTASHRSWGLG